MYLGKSLVSVTGRRGKNSRNDISGLEIHNRFNDVPEFVFLFADCECGEHGGYCHPEQG